MSRVQAVRHGPRILPFVPSPFEVHKGQPWGRIWSRCLTLNM